MAFNYQDIVPWGRSFDEYRRMFDLTPDDLTKSILGCGDGPASFNFRCNQNGGNVISVDPLYAMTREQIEQRIKDTYEDVLSQTRQNQDKFKWDRIGSVSELGQIRMAAMSDFLISFEAGLRTKKYVAGSLPDLPFSDQQFELVLCSHFLFLYSDHLNGQFHTDAISEMLRVANEVRIFPLLDMNGIPSPYLDKVVNQFNHYRLEIRTVDYEFQLGGDQMLLIATSE